MRKTYLRFIENTRETNSFPTTPARACWCCRVLENSSNVSLLLFIYFFFNSTLSETRESFLHAIIFASHHWAYNIWVYPSSDKWKRLRGQYIQPEQVEKIVRFFFRATTSNQLDESLWCFIHFEECLETFFFVFLNKKCFEKLGPKEFLSKTRWSGLDRNVRSSSLAHHVSRSRDYPL